MRENLTIFYTDDDEEDQELFRDIIEIIDNNHNVISQNSGYKLLHALDNPPPSPHVIFLDINMPGISGLETLKKLRASAKFMNVPVVIFSTSSDLETIETSRELGASFYVPKSGVFENLKRSIEHTLKINWSTFIPEKNNFVYNL